MATPQWGLPSRIPMRVAAGLRAKPTTGIQKHSVGKEDRTDTKLLPQGVPRGTTIMMDTRSINTLFNACAINGHGWLA